MTRQALHALATVPASILAWNDLARALVADFPAPDTAAPSTPRPGVMLGGDDHRDGLTPHTDR